MHQKCNTEQNITNPEKKSTTSLILLERKTKEHLGEFVHLQSQNSNLYISSIAENTPGNKFNIVIVYFFSILAVAAL